MEIEFNCCLGWEFLLITGETNEWAEKGMGRDIMEIAKEVSHRQVNLLFQFTSSTVNQEVKVEFCDSP